jgi:hypothetical protein
MLRALLVVALVALTPGDVAADGGPTVTVVSTARSVVRVRLAAGSVFPCDASEDTLLLDTYLDPNTFVRIVSDATDVCFDHTSESFPDGEWEPAEHTRRASGCRRGVCRSWNDPVTFYVR